MAGHLISQHKILIGNAVGGGELHLHLPLSTRRALNRVAAALDLVDRQAGIDGYAQRNIMAAALIRPQVLNLRGLPTRAATLSRDRADALRRTGRIKSRADDHR